MCQNLQIKVIEDRLEPFGISKCNPGVNILTGIEYFVRVHYLSMYGVCSALIFTPNNNAMEYGLWPCIHQ